MKLHKVDVDRAGNMRVRVAGEGPGIDYKEVLATEYLMQFRCRYYEVHGTARFFNSVNIYCYWRILSVNVNQIS